MTINKYQKLLSGGGEMGERIRKKDWSTTEVGNIESWPQSLYTTLSIILNSKFPMFLWWGPELICFYNDAYRPSLGIEGKHPSILGQKAKDAWPEIWNTIKPLIDQVVERNESTWREDQLIPIYRNGKLEDVYWTFSYSPVKDESGDTAGVLVTCHETTQKVKVLEDIQERETQLSFIIDAAEMGTWDLNPITGKFKANGRLKKWLGFSPDSHLNLSEMMSRIAESDRERVTNAIQTILKQGSNGNYEVEYSVINPTNKKERRLLAKGKVLFDDHGTVHRFSGIVQDITEQVSARKKIEESEKRFRNTVKQAPVGICILQGPEFIVQLANHAYLQMIDKEESEFVGHRLFDILPEVREKVKPLLAKVYTTGEPLYGMEFPVSLNKYGKERQAFFNFVYHALREDNGKISGIIVVANEVTELVEAKHSLVESEKQFRHLVMHSPIPMAILRGKDLKIEMSNNAMLKNIWRKEKENVIGKKVLDVFPELNEQKYAELLKKVYSTGKLHKENESHAYVQGDDGILKEFYFDFEYSPLFELEGEISGIMVTANDVTEKVEARKKLEESEKRFRKVADSVPVLIWMSGTDKVCHFFNKAWLNFTGKTMEQEYGNGWIEGVHPDDLEKCLDTYTTSFDKQEEFYMEYRLRRHDGEYRWISDNGVPRFTTDGVFEGYIGACMDIHENIVYQKKVEDAEARTRLATEATDLATWELDLNTRHIIYSPRLVEILGHSKSKILSHQEMRNQLHPDDTSILEAAFEKAIETGIYNYEVRIIKPDSDVSWVRTQGKMFFDEKNKPRKLLGTLRDITEEKARRQELFESEQKFRLLADSMPQHIWTADPNGNFNYYNQSVFDYTGLNMEEINKDGWMRVLHPNDREESIKVWNNSIKTGTDFLFEHRFRRHDGEYHWQLSRAIPQKDSEGNIQMWVGTSTNIQEQKTFASQLEKKVKERTGELAKKNKELEKMNVELESFAYVSSHDLQEPLRKIQIFALRILEKEYENLSPVGKDYFERMRTAAERMQTLIEDLLTYSRTNTMDRVFIKTDTEEIISEVINELKEIIFEKKVTIEVGNMHKIPVIPFQFRQLLLNLLTNSIKFSEAGNKPHIKINSEIIRGSKVPFLPSNKTYCHLSVSDNGIGFDPKYKDQIFEVFQRLHGRENYKGTGIGLAIVKKIIENHDGFITATSKVSQGATFDIYLPVSQVKK